MSPERDPEVAALLAKQAIGEVLMRYCRGIDRLDRELVLGCYWPEATDEHGSFSGNRDEYVAWVFDRILPRYRWTAHVLGNVLVELSPDGRWARSEAYGVARHEGAGEGSDENPLDSLTSGFRYVDDHECRDGEWRILRRRAVLDWTRRDPPELRFEAPPSHRRGRRDRGDAVYLDRPW